MSLQPVDPENLCKFIMIRLPFPETCMGEKNYAHHNLLIQLQILNS
jgi:hypothetical protein